MSAQTYLEILRERAQSVLAGVQRLEELAAEADDDHYSNVEFGLNEADSRIWSTIEWIEEGRDSDA